MEATVFVTIIALLQYSYFGVLVGSARGKYDVPAPAQTGNAQFERMNRVHLNTLEQLIVFIPALWMHAYYANPIYGAILGAIFIIGRLVYRAEYVKDVYPVGRVADLDAGCRSNEIGLTTALSCSGSCGIHTISTHTLTLSCQ